MTKPEPTGEHMTPDKNPAPTFICACCSREYKCTPYTLDGEEVWLRMSGIHLGHPTPTTPNQ